MNNFVLTLLKYKHIVILSTAVVALGLYIVPIDHIFGAPGAEAKSGGSDNKYGRNKFGPPPGLGGENPGHGGSPPGNTPGGSNIPPGLQGKANKDTSIVGGKGGTGGKGDSLSKPNGGGASSKNTGTSAAKSNGGGS